MTEPLRIIQYGIGPIGVSIVRLVAKKDNA